MTTTLATQTQWAQAINSAQREHESRLRRALDLAKEKAGEAYDSRLAAMKQNVPELKRQGVRTASAFGAAFLFGAARGAFGDERFTLRTIPIELLVGIGAHAIAGTALAGTPAGLVAHGAGDAMLGASAAIFGRSLGGWIRERAAGGAASQGAAAGYAPHALPPGYAHALPAHAGAAPLTEADRAMAEAIEVMRAHDVPRAA